MAWKIYAIGGGNFFTPQAGASKIAFSNFFEEVLTASPGEGEDTDSWVFEGVAAEDGTVGHHDIRAVPELAPGIGDTLLGFGAHSGDTHLMVDGATGGHGFAAVSLRCF